MMTFEKKNTIITYRSDLSEVIIKNKKNPDIELEIDGEALLEFIADYIRDERISRLEQMNTEEILGINFKE